MAESGSTESRLDQNITQLMETTNTILKDCKQFMATHKDMEMTLDQCLLGLKLAIDLKKVAIIHYSLLEVIHERKQ